jgi:hypothetical protein
MKNKTQFCTLFNWKLYFQTENISAFYEDDDALLVLNIKMECEEKTMNYLQSIIQQYASIIVNKQNINLLL